MCLYIALKDQWSLSWSMLAFVGRTLVFTAANVNSHHLIFFVLLQHQVAHIPLQWVQCTMCHANPEQTAVSSPLSLNLTSEEYRSVHNLYIRTITGKKCQSHLSRYNYLMYLFNLPVIRAQIFKVFFLPALLGSRKCYQEELLETEVHIGTEWLAEKVCCSAEHGTWFPWVACQQSSAVTPECPQSCQLSLTAVLRERAQLSSSVHRNEVMWQSSPRKSVALLRIEHRSPEIQGAVTYPQ